MSDEMDKAEAEALKEMLAGPWFVEDDGYEFTVIHDDGEEAEGWKTVIATLGQEYREIADLIAAAPQLLAACEAAMRIEALWMLPPRPADDQGDEEGYALHLMRDQLRSAIAAARSEEEGT